MISGSSGSQARAQLVPEIPENPVSMAAATPPSEGCPIATLVPNTLAKIFACLEPIDAGRASAVCTTWARQILQDEHLWRRYCEETFGLDAPVAPGGAGESLASFRCACCCCAAALTEPAQSCVHVHAYRWAAVHCSLRKCMGSKLQPVS